jgi:hypothetical protein
MHIKDILHQEYCNTKLATSKHVQFEIPSVWLLSRFAMGKQGLGCVCFASAFMFAVQKTQ